jgi:NAD(P)-dependent dehydrogenase (short-subunit alcohol dehydrogenase family)
VSLANRHAVVTGGAGEIGLVIARRLSEKGAAITLLDKKISPEVASEVEKLGFRFVASDVTDPTSVAEAMNSLAPIEIAVANAGAHRGARALELSHADWSLMLSVNATGVFLFAQAAARRMVEAGGGGSIVVTGSWVQNVPNVDNTGYCASKAAAAMVARCMALELGEHRIRVNVVAPEDIDLGVLDLHDVERPGRCIFLWHSLWALTPFASLRFKATVRRSMRSTPASIVGRSGSGKSFRAQSAPTCSIRYAMVGRSGFRYIFWIADAISRSLRKCQSLSIRRCAGQIFSTPG